jgi:putative ABC transport system permease protein
MFRKVKHMGALTRAFRNISRRKIRALLVIIALGFSMAIMISIPTGIIANQVASQDLNQNLSNTINRTEASINQTLTEIDCSLTPSFEGYGFGGGFPSGGFPSRGFGNDAFGGGAFGRGGTTPMNESIYFDVSSIQGVAAVAPMLEVSEGHNETIERYSRTFTRFIPDYTIEGIPLVSSVVDNNPILPASITGGRNLQGGDSGVVLLSENNTGYFGVEVNDTVDILGQTFKVIGIHGTSGVEDRLTLYMNLSDAQAITGNSGEITSLQVYADNSSIVASVADAISSLHPELTVTTAQTRLTQLQTLQTDYNTALQAAELTLSQTQSTAVEEMVVVVAATSLIVLFVMLYTVRERTKEIGTLKAIGFSNWNVMRQFMLEGVLLSLLAGIVGIAIASVGAPALSGLLLPHINLFGSQGSFRFGPGASSPGAPSAAAAIAVPDPLLMLLAVGGAVLLGALGSLYPAWRAARIRPAEAMRYE